MERSTDALQFRDAIYEQFARIGKAVASHKRLELLDLLNQGSRTVEELARGTDQSIANASQHLQVLRNAHLVESEKNGLYVHYRLADEMVGDFFRSLRSLAESRLFEVQHATQEFLQARDLGEEVDRERLIDLVRRGKVTVVDLRSKGEFDRGHIPGATHIPSKDLEKHLAELPQDQDVVAYCRGPYCVIGMESVRAMRDAGIRAHRLKEGVPEWKELGFDIETNSDKSETE